MNGEPSDAQSENPEPPPAEPAPPQPQHMVLCRRCRRFSPADAVRCLFCRAPSRDPEAERSAARERFETEETGKRFSALFWIFGLLLAVNVQLFWYFRDTPDVKPLTEPMVRNSAMALTVAEAVDALLVIFAFARLRTVIEPAPGIGRRRRLGWLLAIPLLALLLAANTGYHWVLMTIADIKPEVDEIVTSGHHRIWLLALYCVQPAIIEELFCRRLAFDFFSHHTTVGTAAFASAAMFASMHTGALVAFPYFVLFGFVMAWLRWWSGSLVLPMILHFAHNFLISIHELATT